MENPLERAKFYEVKNGNYFKNMSFIWEILHLLCN